jgi:hypothetical protein
MARNLDMTARDRDVPARNLDMTPRNLDITARNPDMAARNRDLAPVIRDLVARSHPIISVYSCPFVVSNKNLLCVLCFGGAVVNDLEGRYDSAGACAALAFLINLSQVGADGSGGDAQIDGDCVIGLLREHAAQHLRFPWREPHPLCEEFPLGISQHGRLSDF